MRRILIGSSAETNLAAIAVFPSIFLGIYFWRCATGDWASFDLIASVLTLVSAVIMLVCLLLAPRRSFVVAAPIGFLGVRATIAAMFGRGIVFLLLALGSFSIVCVLYFVDAKLRSTEKVVADNKPSDQK